MKMQFILEVKHFNLWSPSIVSPVSLALFPTVPHSVFLRNSQSRPHTHSYSPQ